MSQNLTLNEKVDLTCREIFSYSEALNTIDVKVKILLDAFLPVFVMKTKKYPKTPVNDNAFQLEVKCP